MTSYMSKDQGNFGFSVYDPLNKKKCRLRIILKSDHDSQDRNRIESYDA